MKSGTLYIVATPIGNLEDISLRAIRILKEARLIAAEDTRHTKILLERYGIDTPLTSYHDHNKEEKGPILVSRLLEGEDIALVSDAGTPGISDPGYFLIRLSVQENIPIVPIPGPVAAMAALSVSGLPTDRFVFEGFLPPKRVARMNRLRELQNEERTLIFYEAPHRIIKTLEDMLTVFGNRRTVITRELTKIHEEIIRSDISGALDRLRQKSPRGEFTIIIHGARKEDARKGADDIREYLKNLIIHRGLTKKEAVAAAAKELNLPRKRVYDESLKIE